MQTSRGKIITLKEVEQNKSIGWYVDGNVVKQVMTISPRKVRVVGYLPKQEVEKGKSNE